MSNENGMPATRVHDVVHTPGPWKHAGRFASANDPDVYVEVINDDDGTLIAEAIIETCLQNIPKRAESNARLIAAAPSLLDELRKAVEMLENTVDGDQPACQWWIDEVARLRVFVDSVVLWSE